jgi:hypothetical protein
MRGEFQNASGDRSRRASFVARAAPWFLILLLLALVAGCRLVKDVANVPSQAVRAVTPGKDKSAVDPVDVQQRLLRFADEFAAAMLAGVEKLKRGTKAISPAEVLRLKIVFATEASSIASGPNAIANLLDMTVFVSVVRMAVETHWQPNVYGESAQPLLESCRNFETEIWKLAATVLKPEQQAELREAIGVWRQAHPTPENILGARAVGFASEVAKTQRDAAQEASVFALLRLDPLAGLDPATREIAQARLFAERALYIAQWMPTLLRWQTELLGLNAVAMPEVQQLVANSTQLAGSVDRFARAAEQLPKQVGTEREEILKALESQERGLATLAADVRQTITAGTQMSTSLNTTLTTFDGLMRRFGVGETNNASPPGTNAEPFRILDYAQTASQLETTARRLTELLVTLDRTLGSTNLKQLSAQAGPVIQQAQSSGKEIVDYAFWKGVLLAVIVCGLVWGTVLLNRLLRPRRADREDLS